MARTKAFDKKQVLEKALHLFWRQGYDATSMGDLVKSLGISRSSIYDTFGDKRQLFLDALDLYKQQHSNVLIEILRKHPRPKKAIGEMLEKAMKEASNDMERKGCFIANTTIEMACYDEEILSFARENKARIVAAFTGAIRRGQKAGDISKKYPATQLAEFIFAIYNGLQMVGKFDPDLRKLNHSLKLALSLLDE